MRPRTGNDKKIEIRINPDVHNELCVLAGASNKSLSQYLRDMISANLAVNSPLLANLRRQSGQAPHQSISTR
ncbi:MAG TPA: toxin-antitoxin system HicB family antitoxin [Chloroflexia bacterium]